jgi:hypothetical protein
MMDAYTAELRAPFLPLRRGSTDAGVKRVQEWLCLHGHATGIDGDFGPATAAAVEAFQRANGCLRDDNAGVVDAETWGALVAPMDRAELVSSHPDKFGERVCRIARAHHAARAREVGGDNRGPWVRLYGRGIDQSRVDFFPWCQAFASHVWLKAARELRVDLPFALTTDAGAVSFYVPWVVDRARDAGLFRPGSGNPTVPPGSMFFVPGDIRGRRSHIHVGIVVEDPGFDAVEVIEGNGNDGGSFNGFAVVRRFRRKSACDYGLV